MKLFIDSGRFTLDHVSSILNEGAEVKISDDTHEEVKKSFRFLENFTENNIIYGVNTGFGPMAQHRISKDDRIKLQYNLIRSHSSGAGSPIDNKYVKAGMLARLRNFSLGYSGVHPKLLKILEELINKDVIPFIPEHGGVGASGDLVQLSHMALVLIGEGEVFYKGIKKTTEEVFTELGIEPLRVRLREGLAMINGTSIMTGIGLVNLLEAKKAFNWSLVASTMINEIVQSFDDHFSEVLNGVKNHSGQQIIADAIRNLTSSSSLIKKRTFHHVVNSELEVFDEKFQEYYSLRCLPQILGPIWDTIINAGEVLEGELNSVSDNPVVDYKTERVYHGGNFHGDYVSFEMDKLKIAISKLSMLSERQLNFLMNDKLNGILPPFVNLGKLGLNLGMQGAQFTATSTVAENQTLSFPMYIHSIPNNNDNQDIVSMGTNSALLAKKVIENTFQVLTIQMLTLIQAIDFLDYGDKLSELSKKVYSDLREIVPIFKEDNIIYKDLDKLREYLENNSPNILK